MNWRSLPGLYTGHLELTALRMMVMVGDGGDGYANLDFIVWQTDKDRDKLNSRKKIRAPKHTMSGKIERGQRLKQ